MSTLKNLTFLFATMLLASCYKHEDYDPLALRPDEVITELIADPVTLSANNAATSTITAVLPDGASEGLDVTFKTGKGVFVDNGTSTITIKSKAVFAADGAVQIVASTVLRIGLSPGTFSVSAQLGGYEVSTSLSAMDNPPIAIDVLVPALVLGNDTTSEMEFFAKLIASSGTVSSGHPVTMEAYDQAHNPRGTFRIAENVSGAEGKCRYVFSIVPDWAYTGPLTFKATTVEGSQTYQDSVTIQIY